MIGTIVTIVVALLVGYLAGLMHVRRLSPHPEHCTEVTWCTHCGTTTGTRCPQHKMPATATSDPAERR